MTLLERVRFHLDQGVPESVMRRALDLHPATWKQLLSGGTITREAYALEQLERFAQASRANEYTPEPAPDPVLFGGGEVLAQPDLDTSAWLQLLDQAAGTVQGYGDPVDNGPTREGERDCCARCGSLAHVQTTDLPQAGIRQRVWRCSRGCPARSEHLPLGAHLAPRKVVIPAAPAPAPAAPVSRSARKADNPKRFVRRESQMEKADADLTARAAFLVERALDCGWTWGRIASTALLARDTVYDSFLRSRWSKPSALRVVENLEKFEKEFDSHMTVPQELKDRWRALGRPTKDLARTSGLPVGSLYAYLSNSPAGITQERLERIAEGVAALEAEDAANPKTAPVTPVTELSGAIDTAVKAREDDDLAQAAREFGAAAERLALAFLRKARRSA